MDEEKRKEFLRLFGLQIRKIRTEKRKLSLRELASRCDVEHSKIAKIEKGQIRIQLPTVFELAEGLNVHPRELFNFKFEIDDKDLKLLKG
ncbi:helix-turn-helix domain-containing protein [Sinomicrobium soli]|uniref:helix-turn-helix domain-containing protein n=1 Tax=Sinomicrobium sp. N-1-3-6 TaxID=2219864 RepID=UPI000DCBE9D5|nr:helix-turn-helix transcriptional regulator [Sinomicrobium sp. N-1-3-6]RAV28419.1 XRE family transcriptional regulator [Sinomicrobium sp. N-1-3-6]